MLKDEQKIIKKMDDKIQDQEICTLLKFYEELVNFLLVEKY